MRQILPLLTALIAAAALAACSSSLPPELQRISREPVSLDFAPGPWDHPLDSAPDSGCVRIRFPRLGPIGRLFNDSNHRHIDAAKAAGIEPVGDLRSAWTQSRGLKRIASGPGYYLAPLTHSYPFLVPEASALLDEIAARFADSLQARGGGAYRPKVTSVMRTPHTVGKLRRVNRNASANSAHSYATTFDISYSKFACDDSTATRRTFEDLKNLLATIVRDLRNEGRCYVKHERRQACFHITVRPSSDQNQQ